MSRYFTDTRVAGSRKANRAEMSRGAASVGAHTAGTVFRSARNHKDAAQEMDVGPQ